MSNASSIGTVAGGALGAVFGAPAVGAAIGGAAGNMIDSIIQSKKAREAFPDQDAAELRNYMEYIRSKSRSMETGSAAQNAMNDIKSSSASIVNALGYQGGGANSASNLQMMLRSQGDAFNKVLAGLDERAMSYDSIAANLIQRIQQRRDELGLVQYQQATAEKMQAISNATQNANALFAYSDNSSFTNPNQDFLDRRTDFLDVVRKIGGGNRASAEIPIADFDSPSGY